MRGLEIHLPTLDENGEPDAYDDLVFPPSKGSKCIIVIGHFPGYFAFPSRLGREEVKKRMRKAGYRRFKLIHTHTYCPARYCPDRRRRRRRR